MFLEGYTTNLQENWKVSREKEKAILGFPHPGNFPKLEPGEALHHLHGHRSCARHGLKQGGPFRSRLCFPLILISGEELELAIRSPRVPGEHDSMVSYSPPLPPPPLTLLGKK